MPVQHTYDSSNKTLQISISDHFNFDVHSEFREAYRNIPANGADTVIVDLRRTEYMDSSALGMLLLLDEHFRITSRKYWKFPISTRSLRLPEAGC